MRIVDKLLAARPPLRRIWPSDTVCQFQKGNHRNGHFRVVVPKTNALKHLICRQPEPLRSYHYRSIKDQSHAGGSSGSRWLSIAAFTSLAKSTSMVAVESFGMRARISETLWR